MTHDPEADRKGQEVNRLSYNPMHDYKTVDVDAWAEQWLAPLANLEPQSQQYQDAEYVMHGQMALHSDNRQSNGEDLQYSMRLLRLIGRQNPYDANAESTEERSRHEQWQQDWQLARLTGRQLVRYTLEDAERYAALRVEQETAGTDYLTGLLNRRGLTRHLRDMYRITDQPVRLSRAGERLPPARLTFLYGDVNNFKWFNDNLGHHIGDRVIVEVTTRALAYYRHREGPLMIREGGDEFGTILGDLDAEEADAITQQLTTSQVDKAMGEPYRLAMNAVNERLEALRQSGTPIRVEARVDRSTEQELDAGIRTRHILYINNEPMCPLINIVTMSIGSKFGLANNLDEVDQLKRGAEEAMDGAKQVFRSILGTNKSGGGDKKAEQRL